MKQTMLALACAAVCVAGAETINSVGFENYKGSKLMSNGYDDFGDSVSSSSLRPYFVYDTSDSEDGSTVVSHEGTPSAVKGTPTPTGFGNAYLSLSTEGGTLWRTIKEAKLKQDTGTWDAIASQEVPADTGLYIDTMVQFTPTEDGSGPEIGEDAKLAIWLNVATADDGTATTNLCVRGGIFDGEALVFNPTNFTLVTATKSAPDVRPGKWYRLTVRALRLVNAGGDGSGDAWLSGFQIYLDGELLEVEANESPFGANLGNGISDAFTSVDPDFNLLSVIPSLVNLAPDVPALSAVGFKGSGAIDDFCVTDEEPSFTAATVTTVDFTLTWGEGVSSVTYTIEGETEAKTATKDAVITVDPTKKVTVDATPADWYKITDGSIGEFTVTEDTTQTITAVLDSLANLNITGFDSSVSTTDVKKWADAKKILLSGLRNNQFAYNSFLLGTDLLTADPVLMIDDVTVADGEMTITVAAKKGAADGGGVISLEGTYGVLYVKTGDTLESMKDKTFDLRQGDEKQDDGKLTVTLDAGKFAQVKIGAKPQSAE